MSNRELLLEAAEAIVREDGIDAVTLRAVAARAHFGKSTVHETFGSTGGLVRALQLRASHEMFELLNEPAPEGEVLVETGRQLAKRVAQWAMENPEWARLAVRPRDRHDETPIGQHPLGAQFFAAQHEWLVGSDEEVSRAFERSASLIMLAAIELVSTLDDAGHGAHVLEVSYTTVVKLLRFVVDSAVPAAVDQGDT